VDANLMHDVATGRSITGILHLVSKTPIDMYSRKQAKCQPMDQSLLLAKYVLSRPLIYAIHRNF
jgi:hypothetical protein